MNDKVKDNEINETDSYMYNYELLQESARILSDQATVDVDKIIPTVEAGLQAYKVCMARIEKAEKVLAQMNSTQDPNS